MKILYNFILIIIALFNCSVIFAQTKDEVPPWQPQEEEANFNCELRLRTLDILIQYTDKDDLVIIVSHLGKSENKANLGKRRLYNAKTYYTKGITQFRRTPETIVTAEGERDGNLAKGESIKGKGYLDFYIKGRLKLRLYLGTNRDLYLGPCVSLPEDKPCSTPEEMLFYPCKKI